ncbi:MAG: sigma-70 family RNA polymerase sigma factor [Phycisphaerales bacterium JB063]
MPVAEADLMRVLLREQPRLLAYIRSIVANQHLAEDVFQDISVLALQTRSQLDSESHLSHWLRRTARHKALNAAQKKVNRVHTLSQQTLDLLENEWDQVEQLDMAEQVRKLEYCVDRLPESGRRLIQMRYRDGLSGSAIAEKIGRKTASVYMSLSRLRVALKKCVETGEMGVEHDG